MHQQNYCRKSRIYPRHKPLYDTISTFSLQRTMLLVLDLKLKKPITSTDARQGFWTISMSRLPLQEGVSIERKREKKIDKANRLTNLDS